MSIAITTNICQTQDDLHFFHYKNMIRFRDAAKKVLNKVEDVLNDIIRFSHSEEEEDKNRTP